jgi:hypothetical protein
MPDYFTNEHFVDGPNQDFVGYTGTDHDSKGKEYI